MDLSWMDLDLDGFGFVLSLRTHDVRKPFFVRLGFVSCALEEWNFENLRVRLHVGALFKNVEVYQNVERNSCQTYYCARIRMNRSAVVKSVGSLPKCPCALEGNLRVRLHVGALFKNVELYQNVESNSRQTYYCARMNRSAVVKSVGSLPKCPCALDTWHTDFMVFGVPFGDEQVSHHKVTSISIVNDKKLLLCSVG